ncbi:ATP-grasp domain-containing protein [Paenibacillus sp. SYP-B3998]|uniref:ATP-grasp domain-containing protein n=1 Tax=Paenibacillus sp. SYP-B3998 TaxID=2678564 RepID=A0A6G3ZWA3_9BACL|nr:ATP-grasp domain-containing protein [Paenibacillus sp. SYP-B3998]NEW06395.1 ATP-grasp domain-containing protein [Paenibacillus sp. SYP-B3998]
MNEDQHWNEIALFPSFVNPQQQMLIEQQEQQLLWIAEPQDTVWLLHQPDPQFLAYVKGYRENLPQICVTPDASQVAVQAAAFSSGTLTFMPFMLTSEYVALAKQYGWNLLHANAELVKHLNSKYVTRRLAEENGFWVTQGRFCANPQELVEVYSEIRAAGFAKAVLKQPYGSSGRGLTIIENEDKFRQLSTFIRKRTTCFELLLEAWHPIKQSLNAQLWIGPDSVHLLAVTEQRINDYGVYIGTNYTPNYDAALMQHYQSEMLRLGACLRELGYVGIAGIDSILDVKNNLYPVIEINGRFTQVTYLLPFIQTLLLSYKYVESRYIRLETEEKVSFDEIKSRFEAELQPDGEHQFTIYTFSFCNQPHTNLYRIFILIYGNEAAKLTDMLNKFERFTMMQTSL